ncbi:uncharacterized protein LOC126886482 [Diabrotica virgifera virgifera]|uniref:YqaJ viral recombinase domain-containing protein n=1 Tax=Diabrotica virgifera virgifera TaxID=50390 RepID=A0ABM5KGT0_DIAVI|nr:uncharacterized protein LOC126886482 [Diabrotica virgifera virgifera]
MAGLGETCSHVATILFYLHLRPNTKDESKIACTERLASWPIPPVRNVSMVTVSNMVWTQKQKAGSLAVAGPSTSARPSKQEHFSMTKRQTETLLRKLIKGGGSPAICRLMEPFASEMEQRDCAKNPNDLPETYESWYDEDMRNKRYEEILSISKNKVMNITGKQIENVEVYTRDQSQNNVWFKFRAGRITASKFKSVYRTSIENPSLTVIKGVCYPQKVIFYSRQTSYGLKHEKITLEDYESAMKQLHQNLSIRSTGFFISKSDPEFGASPDALVLCDCCGQGCVEVKCPYLLKSDLTFEQFAVLKNTCLILNNQNITLDKKHAYYYQCQLQMFVTKSKYFDFIVWSKDNIFIERIF